MTKMIHRVRLLLSSPGNMNGDRETVRKVVDAINRDSGRRESFFVEIVDWESFSRPSIGEYPQEVLNEQFPDEIDIFVGLMGDRFGTPTKSWGSGTEEEFRIAHESWKATRRPEIMFYFCEAVENLRGIDPSQLQKRNDFKKEIGELGVYHFEYHDMLEFQLDLLPQLSASIHVALESHATDSLEPHESNAPETPLKHYERLLVENPLVAVDDLMRSASDQLEDYTSTTTRMTSDVERFASQLNKYAKRLANETKNNNLLQISEAIEGVIDSVCRFNDGIKENLPTAKKQFEAAVTGAQRAVELARSQKLESKFDGKMLIEPMSDLRDSMSSLGAPVQGLVEALFEWPELSLDLEIQKESAIAVLNDLVDFSDWAENLISLFLQYLSEE